MSRIKKTLGFGRKMVEEKFGGDHNVQDLMEEDAKLAEKIRRFVKAAGGKMVIHLPHMGT